MEMKKAILDANQFSNLTEFYDEVEAKLTKGLDWKIGRNLNAYNDVLRGGFGFHRYEEKITVHWKNSEKSKKDFGVKETIRVLKASLKTCHSSHTPFIKKHIERLKAGKGKTLFDDIIKITRSHDHVTLKLE